MTEDWGAVTSEELFETCGEIKPLKELVNEASNGPSTCIKGEPDFSFVSQEPMHWWSQPNPKGKLLPEKYQPAQPEKRAPKILKKKLNGEKKTTKAEQRAIQKRVTFDIERFVSTDGLSLDEKRLVELGATSRRNKGINYKQLKNERAATKAAEINNPTPKLTNKIKKKDKGGRKKAKKA